MSSHPCLPLPCLPACQDIGVNSEVLSESFGDEYPLLVDVINSLLIDVGATAAAAVFIVGAAVLLLLCCYCAWWCAVNAAGAIG